MSRGLQLHDVPRPLPPQHDHDLRDFTLCTEIVTDTDLCSFN